MLLVAAVDIGSHCVNFGVGRPIDGAMLICAHSAIAASCDGGNLTCWCAKPCMYGGVCVDCAIGRIRIRGLPWIRFRGLAWIRFRGLARIWFRRLARGRLGAFAGWLLLCRCRGVCCICLLHRSCSQPKAQGRNAGCRDCCHPVS